MPNARPMTGIGGRFVAVVLVLGAGLIVSAAIWVAPVAAQSEAESRFWNQVKETRNPAELRAYLDAFPRGAYADLARARLESLAPTRPSAQPTPSPPPQGRGEGAPPSPPRTATPERVLPPSGGGPSSPSAPPPSVAPGSVLADANVVREVQERLYNLNYEVAVTGRVDETTRKAIRDWQSNTKRTANGELDQAQLKALRENRVPVTWGAIAYVARGASSAVWNRPSRLQAERDAIADCEKNGGSGCKVVTAADNGCGALGFYQGRVGGNTHWGAYAVVRPTLAQAIDSALTECRSQAKRPEECGVRLQMCADGSHKK